MDGEAALEIFNGQEDNYGGVTVNLMEVEPITAEEFDAKLDLSLRTWKDQGKKGIWIKLHSDLSSLVDSVIKRGFTYHHAEKDYIMLTTWIAEPPNTIPANASHRIGIGAFVLNKNNEVLVVQETGGFFKGTGVWKLPTGVINEGEGVWDGAIREVHEETGIDTKFVEVLAFRESHQSFLERKTDIFFLCELEPRTFEINKQESEILDAKWMPIEEYVNQPFNQERELFRFMANICLKRSQEKKNYSGFSTVITKTSTGKETYLYCSTDHANLLNGKGEQASTSLLMDVGLPQIFNGKEDNYGGVTVNLMEVEPMSAQEFDAKLDLSLQAWKDQGKKGIWIKLPCDLSNLVDTTIKRGFTYHHAEKDYIMLTTWISEPPNTIPANASHRIGIGAFVLNKNKEVLVVQETGGFFKGTGVWKLPTGVINEGEGIWAGAVREVQEETGIETKFVEVLAFRESHQSFMERKSSIFLVCELEASTFEIQKQDSEILDAKWMPIEEYVNQPFNQERELFRFMANICLKRSQEKENYSGFSTVITKTSTGKETYLYCSTDHANLLNGKLDQTSTSLCKTLFHKCFCLT